MADDAPDDWDAEMSDDGEESQATVTNGHTEEPTAEESTPKEVAVAPTAESASAPQNSDSEAEVEDENESYESSVLRQYGALLSRRVDLVGDYAGNELFLMDGDSLLLRCFSDKRLDFDNGFQLLHAVYNVEQFLSHLVRRKCNFEIVFFDSTKQLCIPPGTAKKNKTKFLLARAVVIRHLQAHLPESHPDIKVYEFSSYTSAEFDQHLKVKSPYFIMANDGAAVSLRKDKQMGTVQESKKTLSSNRAALREMVLYFIERGFNVALLNGLEWRDTKVMAMVLEWSRRKAIKPQQRGLLKEDVDEDSPEPVETGDKLRACGPGLSQRQILGVAALAQLVGSKNQGVSAEASAQLAHAFLVHQAVVMHTPMSARRLDKQSSSSQ